MKKVILISLVAVLCASCSTSKFLTSDVKPVEITKMLEIEPFSYISLIKKGDQGVLNDSISNVAVGELNKSLEKFRGKLRLSSEEIVLTDSVEREELEKELRDLIMLAERNRSIKNIQITPLIDSLLYVNNERFGLLVVQSGFTRTKGNYRGQIAKGVGIGILTGVLTGMAYTQTPIKANSVLYVMIVDGQNKNVAFYNKSVLQKEPTNKDNITQQINKVFEKYFWNKQ